LDAIQAAVLQVKLRHLARHDAARHRVAGALLAGLEGLVGLELPAAPRPHDAPSSFTLRVTDGRRDALASALHDAGIESRVYYPRLLADEPTCAQARRLDDLVTARRLTAQVLTIPSHAYLDDGQIDRIIGAIRSHFPAGS
ncbi:MAG: DegT/DnrJ/EryC1/StrS family aminotransferase, partial [Myxococcales bacterium]|nr:DegT/DnrJ/EryC1/StrS family aminotransferase [Myxococcales bacterium]